MTTDNATTEAPRVEKRAPRKIADDLALRFHALYVQSATGASEETTAAYSAIAHVLRNLAEQDGRVTRKAIWRVCWRCHNDATTARHNGHGEYARTLERCIQQIDQTV